MEFKLLSSEPEEGKKEGQVSKTHIFALYVQSDITGINLGFKAVSHKIHLFF